MKTYSVLDSPLNENVFIFDNLKLVNEGLLPEQFKLQTFPSRSQNFTSWCVGFASSNMLYCDMLTRYGKDTDFAKGFSPEFVMAYCKAIDRYPNEKGTTLEAACQVLTTKGDCRSEYLPFKGDQAACQNQFATLTKEMLQDALRYKSDNYARCSNLEAVKKAIVQANGALVSLNIFANYDKDSRGVILLPHTIDKIRGRHCVFACGYDDNLTFTTPTGTLKGCLVVQESDRLQTSANGFRFLPYAAFTTYTREGDRVFHEAWCTYENNLIDPSYHQKANLAIPDSNHRIVKLKLNDLHMTVNGQEVLLDVAPQVVNSTTLLPLRAIGEAMAITIVWNNTSKQAKAYDPETGRLRYFKLNDNRVYDGNGQIVFTGLANTQIIQNRIMIPVRALAESFGATITYKHEDKSITIKR